MGNSKNKTTKMSASDPLPIALAPMKHFLHGLDWPEAMSSNYLPAYP